jgi:Protein of unknown function (DUF4235)
MPSRSDVLVEQLEELQQNLRELWQALTRDPKKEARKERAWTIVAGVATAVSAIVARRVAARIWGILTGEEAPITRRTRRPAGGGAGGPSSRREEERQPQRDETAAPA